jgi:CRP-like cAMP-binding protein
LITFIDRFRGFCPLTASEEGALTGMVGSRRDVPKRGTIRRQGDAVDEFFILRYGSVASFVMAEEGARFITKIHLPGDIIGSPSMSSDVAAETMVALTDAEIATVSLSSFGRLLEEHPRLGAIFLLSVQYERVELTSRLLHVGRASAEVAIASLLLDLYTRLDEVGDVRDDSFDLHLTQDEIGDATGNTGVHVNRTFRDLRQSGVIDKVGRRVQVTDLAQLERISGRKKRPRRTRLDWLPPSR